MRAAVANMSRCQQTLRFTAGHAQTRNQTLKAVGSFGGHDAWLSGLDPSTPMACGGTPGTWLLAVLRIGHDSSGVDHPCLHLRTAALRRLSVFGNVSSNTYLNEGHPKKLTIVSNPKTPIG
jgi:hypothetical protein